MTQIPATVLLSDVSQLVMRIGCVTIVRQLTRMELDSIKKALAEVKAA